MTTKKKLSSAEKHGLRPIVLCLDYDGTLTERDTMASFAAMCYQFQADHDRSDFPPWEHFVNAYINDYETHVKNYRPKPHERHAIKEEADWLKSLEPIERASLQRTTQSGIFGALEQEWERWLRLKDDDGLLNSYLYDHVTPMRRDWFAACMKILENWDDDARSDYGSRVEVVSVNWSRSWIRMSTCVAEVKEISSWGLSMAGMQLLSAGECLDNGPTWFEDDHFIKQKKPLFTSNDKMKAFILPLEVDWRAQLSPGQILDHPNQSDDINAYKDVAPATSIRIYVGDSTTDLECLLVAHLGICMQDEPLRSGQRDLSETLARIGVPTKKLADFDDEDQHSMHSRLIDSWPKVVKDREDVSLDYDDLKNFPRTIYIAKDFTEVNDWIDRWHATFNT